MDIVYSNRIEEPSESGVRTLSTALKTLRVLDVLAASPKGMRLSEIAKALEVSMPTAYQRVLTLRRAGWIEQGQGGDYRLSLHACRVGAAAVQHASFGERVVPVLEALVARVGESASIAVLDNGVPCVIQRVDANNLLRAEQKIGSTMSLEGSASGRVLLAFADEATLARLRQGSEPMPKQEILAAVLIDGYAVSSGYTNSGVRAIAAPLFDFNNVCTATISLAVPEMRFDLNLIKGPLLEAAQVITQMQRGK